MKGISKIFANYKIGTKLTVSVGTLMVVLFVAMAVISVNVASNRLRGSIDDMVISKASDAASLISRDISYSVEKIETISMDPRVKSLNWNIQKANLEENLKNLSFVDRFGIADLEGNVKYTNDVEANIAEREHFKRALNGESYMTDPMISIVDNSVLFVIVSPIKDDKGEIRQVLVAAISSDYLSNFTNEIKFGKEGYAYVINGKGTLIAHIDGQKVINQENPIENAKNDGSLKELADHLTRMTRKESNVGTYTYEGEKKFMAYSSIGGTDWSIAVTATQDEMLSELYTLRTFIIGFVIFAILMGIAITLLISNRMIKTPINKLMRAVEKLATGDVDVRLDVNSNDELGVLGKGIADIIDATKQQAVAMENIAKGNLTIDVKVRSQSDVMGKSMQFVIKTLKGLVEETVTLSNAAIEGRLTTRGDFERFHGGYRKIVLGVNKTIDSLVGFIDEIPSPVVIIDRQFNIQYINKIGADFAGSTPSEMINTNYNESYVIDDFNTDSCSTKKAMEQNGKFNNNTSAIINGNSMEIAHAAVSVKNEASDIIGSLEVITDLTEIKKAQRAAQKISAYQSKETDKIKNALLKIASGNLDVSVEVDEGDEDISEVHETFSQLADALNLAAGDLRGIIEYLSKTLGEISKGNLDIENDMEFKGDFIEISRSVDEILNSLNIMMSDMTKASEQVASGSRQVSDGSQALSQGSTEQAGSIEELTASITEVGAQTKQNAINASKANEFSIAAKEDAVVGNSQMQKMLSAMTDINDSSSNISKIIKVIDEIAFQTNILALNAAVEAARAGQHGKGFAVVAEEVRNLAARSANAAKETTDLIEGSMSKAKDGTKIANQTADALTKIVDGVEKAAALIGEIATASNEQATGIAQINKGIEQVSKVVQTNSATAEQSAAASEELSSQAELLKEMVSKFKVKKNIKKISIADVSENTVEIEDVPQEIISEEVKEEIVEEVKEIAEEATEEVTEEVKEEMKEEIKDLEEKKDIEEITTENDNDDKEEKKKGNKKENKLNKGKIVSQLEEKIKKPIIELSGNDFGKY